MMLSTLYGKGYSSSDSYTLLEYEECYMSQ